MSSDDARLRLLEQLVRLPEQRYPCLCEIGVHNARILAQDFVGHVSFRNWNLC